VDEVRVLREEEWCKLREIRLAALSESPDMFLSTFARESAFDEQRWRAEFDRGEWLIRISGGKVVGLLGVTREKASPPDKYYLEYMWVTPEFRRSGIASDLIKVALGRLNDRGITTAWLWILNGNDTARRLYLQRGFTSTGIEQPLPNEPSRSEELMKLALG
jgi:ribosomal protein S18 acetylase RimI-like enzyme